MKRIRRQILIFKVDRALQRGYFLKAARLLNIDFMKLTNEQLGMSLLIETTRLKMDPKMTDEEFSLLLKKVGIER